MGLTVNYWNYRISSCAIFPREYVDDEISMEHHRRSQQCDEIFEYE